MTTGHPDNDRLQDLHEGLLSPDVEEEVRAHLAACAACRKEYERLSELMEGLGELPGEAQPERDLWPQIEWRIEKGGVPAHEGRSSEVLAGASSGAEARQGIRETTKRHGFRRPEKAAGRRFSVSAWQMLAASVVVALISGSAVWAFLNRTPVPGATDRAVSRSAAQAAGWVDAFDGYDQALSDLETVLKEGRDVLDPETVQVLEENLATIDRAIEQSREALQRDPGSLVLQRLLSENLRRKVDLLRHAALAVLANT